MPVEDHEVHDKVRIKVDEPYGCNSRTGLADHYYALDRRVFPDGSFEYVSVRIHHRMSTPCRNFYLWDKDTRCSGCTTERDEEYANKMSIL